MNLPRLQIEHLAILDTLPPKPVALDDSDARKADEHVGLDNHHVGEGGE